MKYKQLIVPAFNIIGITIRTTNENLQCQQDMGALWQRFMAEDIMGQIPNRIDQEIVAVYSDYELDYTKPYSYTIGCRVKNITDLPEGMTAIAIPTQTYAVVTAKGKMPDCLAQSWQEIWQADIERAYNIDFEIYGANSQNRANAEVDIYLSLK